MEYYTFANISNAPRTTGVYFIICGDRRYVGSAAKSFQSRWRQHLRALTNKSHRNSFLQRLHDKHGVLSLQFQIAEECGPSECLQKEQHWITDTLSKIGRTNLLNASTSATSTRLGTKSTPEHAAKISAARKGKTFSQNHKAALRKSMASRRNEQSQRMLLLLNDDRFRERFREQCSKAHVGLGHKLDAIKVQEIRTKIAEGASEHSFQSNTLRCGSICLILRTEDAKPPGQ